MAQYQTQPVLDKVDPVWARIRREAEDIVRREPELATFIYSTILHHDTLEGSIAYRLSERLDHAALSGELLRQAYADALEDTPSIGDCFRADIAAVVDRDPATYRLIEPVLYYRAFTPSRPTGWRTGFGAKAAAISRSTCKAARRRCSSATSIRPRASAAAFFLITPPALWSARPRRSRTTCRCCMT